MESSNVAKFLLVPVEIVLSLIRNPQEAACLLETTFRGQQLQDLLVLQATQQQCDASALQKVCTSLLSLNDASLAALVPPAIQAASAATRAADVTQTKLKECLDALQMLSGHLKRHSEISSAVAVEMRRQPACQELAIERELVARIQAEAAQRAGHIARLRGHCSTLTPFSQVLEIVKADAALKLQRLAEGNSGAAGQTHPRPTNAHQMTAAAPLSTLVTKTRLDNIEKGLHAVNAHANQPQIIRSLTGTQRQQQQQREDNDPIKETLAPSMLIGGEAAKRKAENTLTQSKALRGDAAPSTSNDNVDSHGTSSGANRSQSQPQVSDRTNPGSTRQIEGICDDGVENGQQQQQQTEFCFIAPPRAAIAVGNKGDQQQKQDEDPSPTPQVAPNNTEQLQQQQNVENGLEKENVDLTQSQGEGVSARSGSKQEPEKRQEEEDADEEAVPTTQPLSAPNPEEAAAGEEEEIRKLSQEKDINEALHLNAPRLLASGQADGATAPIAAPAATGNHIVSGRGFLSQRDSYSPGSTLNPNGSGAHTGSGSGSGSAAAAAAAANRGTAALGNEDTPAWPSRVAPPVSLQCCPPPLPPPSFPSSSSAGIAAGGGGEKRSHHQHTTGGVVGAGGSGGASIQVKRTRFATEAEAAAAALFEREKSASQDVLAEQVEVEDPEILPLGSGPSSGNLNTANSDGSGGGGCGGGAPGTADWKTPGETPYGRTFGPGYFPPTLSTWNFSQEDGDNIPQEQRAATAAGATAAAGLGGGGGDVGATPFHQTMQYLQHRQHKSWIPSTIKPSPRNGGGGANQVGAKAKQPPPFCSGGGGNGSDQLFPLSQDQDSPRVAGAQKGATPMFLNSFPTSGGPSAQVTPATCASWKAGEGERIKEREKREREEEEEEMEQGGEDGCNASNQLLRRKTPGS